MAAQKVITQNFSWKAAKKLQQGRTEWDCLRLTAEQLSRLFDRPILYALSKSRTRFVVPGGAVRCTGSPGPAGYRRNGRGQVGTSQQQVCRRNHKYAAGFQMVFSFCPGDARGHGNCSSPRCSYSIPDAFEKNLLIAILNECGLSQERIRLQEERGKEVP